MHNSSARRFSARLGLASGLAVLLGSTALSPAFAQPTDQPATPPPPASASPAPVPAPPPEAVAPPAPPPPRPEQTAFVNRIVVQGNERIELQTILSYLPISVGDQVTPSQIDLALKALFKTELFADVTIRMDGGDLVVKLVENPIINQVVFEGNNNLKEDKLRDEVTVRPRGIFTKAKVQQDVGRIIELYRRAGRISATVTPKIVELPQKRVDLVFEIHEGPKSGVMRINFLGNRKFSDNDLRDVMVTKESRIYRLLSSNDNYDPDRLEYDQEQLRKFYRNRGYYDFRVVNAVAELAPDKNGFVITMTIDEGQRYKFGKLKVQTDVKKLNGDILKQLLPIREGQIYQDEKIEQATDALTFAAGAAGYAFVDVAPRYVPNRKDHTVDVTFEVKEGPRVYVERIDIIGNTRTLDRVVRREMRLTEGDAYNRVLVDRSKNQVLGLGFFKDVDVTNTPGSAPDRTNVRVKVTEQPTGELSLQAGYSSVDQFEVEVGISERNFRGRGQAVDAQVSIGSLRQRIQFSFTEPRFLGRELGAGFDLYSFRYDFTDQAGYSTASTGGGVHFQFPISTYAAVTTRYNLHVDSVSVANGLCAAASVSSVLCTQLGDSITSLVGYSLRWDHRNDPVRPTRGFFMDFSQDFAGVAGDVRYIRTESDGSWFHGFTPALILSVNGSFGFIDGWGGDTVRINDRFYKGGNTFRGFQNAGIGPRDTIYDEALGGKLYAIGSVEMTLPNYLPEQYGIKTALFTEFGTEGLLDSANKLSPVNHTPLPYIRDDLGLRAAAGISVFWKSPLGPLRFDISQVLSKEPYDKTEAFRFSTSTKF